MIPLVYDQLNSCRIDEEFFVSLLDNLNVKNLADLGCGTGRLSTRFSEMGLRTTGIDPNAKAIEQAKLKEYADQVNWIVGDSTNLLASAYDVVIMTANVAQVFLTDEIWTRTISDVYGSLNNGGHFIFDTRNPLAKVWEEWEKDDTPDTATDLESGDPLEIITEDEGLTGEVYTFYESVRNTRSGQLLAHVKMQLRFRTYEALVESLKGAGFAQIQAYGDWEFKKASSENRSFIFHCVK